MFLPISLLPVHQLESIKEVTTNSSSQGPAPGFGNGVYLEMKAIENSDHGTMKITERKRYKKQSQVWIY